MLPLEDLPALALFARVVQLKSFSAAARDAHLAKSAVSKRIAGLERRLGARLLHRSTRRLSLTDEGTRLFEHAAAMLAAAEAASGVVAASEAAGTIRLNAPVTFAQMHLAVAVAEFLATRPGLRVDLATDNGLVDPVEGGYDLVVRVGVMRDGPLYAKKLADDRLVVCASPAYLARAGEPLRPDELVHHQCLHYALVPLGGEWRFRGENSAISVPVRPIFTSADGTVLREAAVAGAGLAVVPSFMVARDVEQGRLRLVLEGARRAAIGIWALRASRAMPPRTRALLDFLVARFARVRWL